MSVKFNPQLSHSLGQLTRWEKISQGITGETENGNFRVLIYDDAIVRLSITKADDFEDFSYAVVAQPGNHAIEITESDNHIHLKTGKLVLTISKNPVRFSFANHKGEVINEDDPAFGTSWIGEQVTTYKKIQEEEHFIGLGEKTGPLDRKGTGYVNWNTDSFAYGTSADPLYSTIPFYIGVHHKLVYGIFFDNSHKSFFNFGASNNRFASFAADAGEMNYYFIAGETVPEVIRHYTHLTGRMELPPLWSIGYQQCRYSYYPDKEVLGIARHFRDKEIPADVIVLDIHYMDDYKIFSWHKKAFTSPKKLLDELQNMGFEVVLMCDPGIKVEEGYTTYEDGVRNDVFIKYPDGTYYTGQVWPGWCHFPDFTNPKTRSWWKEQFKDYVALGVQGFWNDMNEIATWGNMLPENVEFDFEGNKGSMRKARNLFGLQMARSTYEGTKALMKNRRPFNLTRSGYSGIQRYAAVWTGDNVAYDEHMMLGVRMVNSMGLSGIAFGGYDVGGFVGNADSKLFARWISIGAFSPFFRGHSMINSRDSEPWSFGEEVEQISRNYIRFRYQLMPYIYAAFYEASLTGMPVQRSLAIDYPHDPKIYDGHYHNQYLFGPSLLVAPVESSKDFVKVYLPEGNDWYYLYNGKKYSGGSEIIMECPIHKLPVFVKAGAIITMESAQANTREKNDHVIVHIYKDVSNTSFLYYQDDGVTFDYQKGKSAQRLIEYKPLLNKIIIHKTEGDYKSPVKKIKLILHGFEKTISSMYIGEKEHPLEHFVNQFFTGLEKYDPIKDPEPAPQEDVVAMEFDYSVDEIVLHWL
jgi:alpha-glucosidase